MTTRSALLLLGGAALTSCGTGGSEVPAPACDEPPVHELGVPLGDRAAQPSGTDRIARPLSRDTVRWHSGRVATTIIIS